MNILLFIILFNWNVDSNTTTEKATKIVYISSSNDLYYNQVYNETIYFIKKNEGFSATWYDDEGFKTIGYGQRQAFYHKRIVAPITEEQGEEILRDSFNKHILLVQRLYPKFNRFQLLAMAHLSYNAGVSKVKSVIKDNNIIRTKLYSISYRKNRVFEYKLFNYGKEACKKS